MNTIDSKKYDDIYDDIDDNLLLCNCNLCWTSRHIMSILSNNIIFKNIFVLFIITLILFITYIIFDILNQIFIFYFI